jgi:hypothetical protein
MITASWPGVPSVSVNDQPRRRCVPERLEVPAADADDGHLRTAIAGRLGVSLDDELPNEAAEQTDSPHAVEVAM